MYKKKKYKYSKWIKLTQLWNKKVEQENNYWKDLTALNKLNKKAPLSDDDYDNKLEAIRRKYHKSSLIEDYEDGPLIDVPGYLLKDDNFILPGLKSNFKNYVKKHDLKFKLNYLGKTLWDEWNNKHERIGVIIGFSYDFGDYWFLCKNKNKIIRFLLNSIYSVK